MVLLLIFSIIGAGYCVYKNIFNVDSTSTLGIIIDYTFNIIIGGLIGGIIAYTIAWALPMDTYDKEYSYNIETLQDNSSLSGEFFLGTGQVEGKIVYVLYYEDNGYYKMIQLDQDLVKIKYSNNKAKLNVIENYPKKSFINYLALDEDIYSKRYIIEVPRGTIKNNYNLDAQ